MRGKVWQKPQINPLFGDSRPCVRRLHPYCRFALLKAQLRNRRHLRDHTRISCELYRSMRLVLRRQRKELVECLVAMENPGLFKPAEVLRLWDLYEEKWQQPIPATLQARSMQIRTRVYAQWRALWWDKFGAVMECEHLASKTRLPRKRRALDRLRRDRLADLEGLEDKLCFWEQHHSLYRPVLPYVQAWSRALDSIPDRFLRELEPASWLKAREKGRSVCSDTPPISKEIPSAGSILWNYSVGEVWDAREARWVGGYGLLGIATGEYLGAFQVQTGMVSAA